MKPLTSKEQCMDLLYQFMNGLITEKEYWEKIQQIKDWKKYVCKR